MGRVYELGVRREQRVEPAVSGRGTVWGLHLDLTAEEFDAIDAALMDARARERSGGNWDGYKRLNDVLDRLHQGWRERVKLA